MELVVATRNRKKIEEIGRILRGLPVTLLSLDDFPGCPEVEESENSFEGNALKKARETAAFAGKAAIADDSGLEVGALGGEPGVFSARYAGADASDADNVDKLIREMRSVERRDARFVCVIALAFPDGKTAVFEGIVEGSIGRHPEGTRGFGYDPVFYPLGCDRTFAEMTPAEKDSMSHRGKALERLRKYLEETVLSG